MSIKGTNVTKAKAILLEVSHFNNLLLQHKYGNQTFVQMTVLILCVISK